MLFYIRVMQLYLTVLGALVCDKTDDDECDDRDTGKYTETNRQNGEMGARKLELGGARCCLVRSGTCGTCCTSHASIGARGGRGRGR